MEVGHATEQDHNSVENVLLPVVETHVKTKQ